MRSISPAGLAKLATRYGNEPITIIEVDWAVGRAHSYADRDVSSIPGRIIDVGDLDNIIGVSDNNSSQSLDVTLDDTDGTIKAIFDGYDIHKRDVRVYQWFEGLALTDKFLLFAGKISSPITWNERDRTVKFTIISQLEDKEVGFSAEEGQFPYLPADLVGKAWPLIFGAVQDSPALQVNHAVTGTTLTPVGIIAGQSYYNSQPLLGSGGSSDSGAYKQLAQISAQISTLWCAYACWDQAGDGVKAEDYLDQINDLEDQRAKISRQMATQAACARWSRSKQLADANTHGLGTNPINVLGGEDFPQNQTIVLDINGGLFTGHFAGAYFYIESRYNPDFEQKAADEAADRDDTCPYEGSGGTEVTKYDYRIEVPCSCMWANFGTCECRHYGFIISTIGSKRNQQTTDPILQQFWVEAGASVKMYSAEPITYIVSIVPGTVLAVKAYKQFTGERRLVDVPTDLYTVASVVYGTVTAVQITFTKPLSTIADQGWSDDIYVTFQSSIGPNIVDILIYLIDTYTDLTYDATTFAYVRTKLVQYPANFPILDRKNTLTVLQEIAYQARCALWISNGVFYIKYLPEVPTINDTIDVSDVEAEKGIEVDLTSTENLVTKMVVKWRVSWAPGQTDREKDKSEKTIILRHNIERYGTQEEEYDFYIYNQPDTVLKCATFWLIRKSHTWKMLKFKTFLNKLNLETFDCVNLDFAGGYVATGAVLAIVNKASYNSADNTVDFECTVPVRSGTMTAFDFYWPAALPLSRTWPPAEDIASGDAGGGGIGAGATGNLPIGDTTGIEDSDTVFVGGPNVVFRAQSDRGDRHPTDIGFAAQTIINPSVYGELDTTQRPHLNLRMYMSQAVQLDPLQQLKGAISIDIRQTKVFDSESDNPDIHSHLSTLLQGISESGDLVLRDAAMIGNDENPDGTPLTDVFQIGESGYLCLRTDLWFLDMEEEGKETNFDFKYDDENEVWGAGTAFLQDV
jgi:hypothetical protein